MNSPVRKRERHDETSASKPHSIKVVVHNESSLLQDDEGRHELSTSVVGGDFCNVEADPVGLFYEFHAAVEPY